MLSFLEFITEAKNVGIIYHFTHATNIRWLLEKKLVMHSNNNNNISFTRNFQLPVFNNEFRKRELRIAVDGTKMSNNYKIRPVAGLISNKPEDDIFSFIHNKNNRVNRKQGEYEEAVLKSPLDISKFVLEIAVKNTSKIDLDELDEFKKINNKIKTNIVRHWEPYKDKVK